MKKSEIFDQVYDLVAQIPPGKVVTYGDIARTVNINPRYVGYILHQNPSQGTILCHRVVSAEGKVAANFAFGGGKSQENLLASEGVVFVNGKMDLNSYRYLL